jgi:hypothetical protein
MTFLILFFLNPTVTSDTLAPIALGRLPCDDYQTLDGVLVQPEPIGREPLKAGLSSSLQCCARRSGQFIARRTSRSARGLVSFGGGLAPPVTSAHEPFGRIVLADGLAGLRVGEVEGAAVSFRLLYPLPEVGTG